MLKLKTNLYGSKSAPRNWFHHLRDNLEKVGLVQQIDVDPCLFLSDKVTCVTCVDDCLFAAQDPAEIKSVLYKLCHECEMHLEEEDDVSGFLGVKIEKFENVMRSTHLPAVSTLQ